MGAYILRRLLIMIPTFFGISLVIFVVLNMAPGRPGAARQGDQAMRMEDQGTQESFRLFKEQFALDKPTLLNTHFLLTFDEVADRLTTLARGKAAPLKDRLRARDELEDFGSYAVPHLVRVLRQTSLDSDEARVTLATYYLGLAARRPLVDAFAPDPSDAVRAHNRRVEQENETIRQMRYTAQASRDEKLNVVQAWLAWYEEHRARFVLSQTDKLKALFFDTRFARYWGNLVRLDFGVSLVTKEPVMRTLVGKLKYSLALSIGSLVLAYLIAIPLGVFSAVRRETRVDQALTVGLFMLYSLPTFFVATLLLYFFSEGSGYPALRIFPTGGFQSQETTTLTFAGKLKDVAWHLTLPLFCMTYGSLAAISRYMRSGLLEVIAADYIRTAYAKGLGERRVILKHALRNGFLPILTLLSGLLPAVLGGSVIVEYIFGIPGMGLWVIESIYQRDYNVIMGVQLLSTVLVLVGILITDLSYALVDPRIRYS